ncbi:MAG: hypothetical protein PHQ27_05230 [Victivallales bacterium]|nr:hypothetical protein [Victivallales bacterium]
MGMMENRKNWNEFQWEREFRKDGNRIHYYFQELPHFIDLPEEEEIILKKMKLNPELVSQNDNWDDFAPSLYGDDPDDDIFISDDWIQKDTARFYMQLSKLATQWNIMMAAELPEKFQAIGLHITCLYGQALAYTAELLDSENDDAPGFTISIGKRLLHEFNQLVGKFSQLAGSRPQQAEQLVSYINHLQSLREKLLAMIIQARTGSNTPPPKN